MMAGKAPNLIQSGTEPVDRLLGGLKSGRLYLVHGDAAGKSLFGIRFIIEGLKRGENAALVIHYSPEDAVRRFARLGYDCLEDVYSGRLVILEYSDDIINQISNLRAIAPVLRELEWLLGETRPQRIIFDPVSELVVGHHGDLYARAKDFADWALSFGATVVMVAGDENPEVIHEFKPMVEESFRFEVKETPSRAVRVFAFEKSADILPQAIEVDPSRGVFLIERTAAHNRAMDAALPSDAHAQEPIEPRDKPDLPPESASSPQEGAALDQPDEVDFSLTEEPQQSRVPSEDDEESEWRFESLADVLDDLVAAVSELRPGSPPEEALADDQLEIELTEQADFEEYHDYASESLTPQLIEDISPPVSHPSETSKRNAMSNDSSIAFDILTQLPQFEVALRPSPVAEDSSEVNPKNFKVLVIDHDRSSRDFVARALSEYTVEAEEEGLGGLAKLRSFAPDLLILDFDLPIVDGFKLLTQIRRNFNLPIIVVSASHLRASDRVRASELGADYYMTKPFVARELRFKVRQLIARHRGIASWITTASEDSPVQQRATDLFAGHHTIEGKPFLPFGYFAAQVEKCVKSASEGGPSFSVVGCRLPGGRAGRGSTSIQLFDLMRSTVRDTDLISTNSQNEFVVLLSEADANGGKAFVNRLRERVKSSFNEEPSIWMRSFPELKETRGPARPSQEGGHFNRRASDRGR
jgi:CheY-like chemotaxis protein/archaellum biogenesis ATPase FlaH